MHAPRRALACLQLLLPCQCPCPLALFLPRTFFRAWIRTRTRKRTTPSPASACANTPSPLSRMLRSHPNSCHQRFRFRHQHSRLSRSPSHRARSSCATYCCSRSVGGGRGRGGFRVLALLPERRARRRGRPRLVPRVGGCSSLANERAEAPGEREALERRPSVRGVTDVYAPAPPSAPLSLHLPLPLPLPPQPRSRFRV
ncbi:hypothetical protein B0H13DRAFT_630635 [Mycena leptocephala]|nr:hypothetical protein B0H13DRAFT_630635 [Mycena leptocephala]